MAELTIEEKQRGSVAPPQPSKEESKFDRNRHIAGAILGPLCAVLIWLTPIDALKPEAHHLLAIMSLVAIWWICEPVPIPVTSLIGPTLCVILGVVNMKTAFAAFASPMIFLFMGGFIIAKAMMVNGLDKRIAYGIMSMKWVGDSPRRIFIAIGLACMMCSGWISNTATAAMMFPIALGLLETIREMMASQGKHIDLSNYKYATGLMLMTAYACSIGGVLTPIGTPPNIIMIGFLDEMAKEVPHVSFFNWMVWGSIAMVLYFLVAYVVLWRLFPAEVSHIAGAKEFIAEKVRGLGKWTRSQVCTLIGFSTAVILWVLPGVLSVIYGSDSEILKDYNKYFPEAAAAMVGALLLFFLPGDNGRPALRWKQAVEGVEWGTLLLFGGGLAMGGLMYTTGLSDWIGEGLKLLLGQNPSSIVFVGIFCVAALLLSELTSHTAATNLIGPIAIGTALSLGINPVPVAVGIALSSSLGFMMPVSTPPNAIVYASGYIPITKMIKSGLIIDIIGIFLITIPIVLLLVNLVLGN